MLHRASLEDHRRLYAELVARSAGVTDRRIEEAFAAVPREAFLPPGPWTVIKHGVAVRTPTDDPAHIYQDVLVALDAKRGINNGEPGLHAVWLDRVSPRPGDAVVHIGAGMGYYTALLAVLVAPGGRVDAYEIDTRLADAASRNLTAYGGVTVHPDSALEARLPDADVIYVNAGVAAPEAGWLRALRAGGRMIFPWQPSSRWGSAVLVRRGRHGFEARAIMRAGFIPCSGQLPPRRGSRPSMRAVGATRSVWLISERAPDETATAIYDEVWFSARDIAGAAA